MMVNTEKLHGTNDRSLIILEKQKKDKTLLYTPYSVVKNAAQISLRLNAGGNR